MLKSILVSSALLSGIGAASATYLWQSDWAEADLKSEVFDSCHKNSFCESVLDVHYHPCRDSLEAIVASGERTAFYQGFASCVNDRSGYELLKLKGEILTALRISH